MTQELEHEDWGQGEAKEPAADRVSVVSVRFRATDFARVAAMARGAKISISAYIRDAALEKAARRFLESYQWSAGNRSITNIYASASPWSGTSTTQITPIQESGHSLEVISEKATA